MRQDWKGYRTFLLFIGFVTGIGGQVCAQYGTGNNDNSFFENLFKHYPGKFDSVQLHRIANNVQVIYTQINRDKNGTPAFQQFFYNKKDARYFYPASAVKLPIAILALQKLRSLGRPDVTMNTTMITEAGFRGQTAVYMDPNTPDGRPTIAQYIKKMLLVSDNDAYNRLYEFLGQRYINDELNAKGYKTAQILHRLETGMNEEENRHTNPIRFYNGRQLIFTQEPQNNLTEYEKRNDFIGKGYFIDTAFNNGPMNFSGKNRVSLEDLNNMMISLLFPAKVTALQRFNITEEDRRFILKYMSALPGESIYPSYDSSYYDTYAKFLLCGAEAGTMPKGVRIFNKVGEAYGQLTDVAYIVDVEKKIEFMVAATIYCNKDEILNDDEYDYEAVGLPFLKDLGKALYEVEMKRKKNILPDLSSIIFTYDK